MIVFDLKCGDGGERFEAWFKSNAEFERQAKAELVECPYCRSTKVTKAPMAPRVPRKAGGGSEDWRARLAAVQAELLRGSRWVGDGFAETARAMHFGEMESAPVHGEATLEQAKSLVDEGVPIAPLPLPVIPPAQVN